MVLLALRVNVSLELRKTQGTWLVAFGLLKVPCRTHHWTEYGVSWCIASGLISPGLEHLVGVFRVVTFNMHMMTDWFHSTLLEKRTKESSICARSRVVKRVVKPAGTMKVIAGICPSANDRTSTLRVFQAANQLPF